MSNWLVKAKQNLFAKSREKRNFDKARLEWVYYGMRDTRRCDSMCQLCNHERIRYEYIIFNKYTRQAMIVGSECIQKFTEEFQVALYDKDGNVVTEKRLTEDKNKYLKEVLYRELDEKIVPLNNTFYNSIVTQIKEDGKLSPLQLRYLRRFYDSLNETGKSAFKMVIKVNLKTNKQKEQMSKFNWYDLQFVGQFMSSTQRDRYDIVLK
ncbi:hypothetical protein ACQUY5_16630 [Bacillus cereus]|uniref:hypothetical protein n=1 Tax=Bacillus cereus TaxID=1396 RepID=UPI003D184005